MAYQIKTLRMSNGVAESVGPTIPVGDDFDLAVLDLLARQIIMGEVPGVELVLADDLDGYIDTDEVFDSASRFDNGHIANRIRELRPDDAETIIAEAWPD